MTVGKQARLCIVNVSMHAFMYNIYMAVRKDKLTRKFWCQFADTNTLTAFALN